MKIKDKDDELYIYFEIFIRVVLFVFVSVKKHCTSMENKHSLCKSSFTLKQIKNNNMSPLSLSQGGKGDRGFPGPPGLVCIKVHIR